MVIVAVNNKNKLEFNEEKKISNNAWKRKTKNLNGCLAIGEDSATANILGPSLPASDLNNFRIFGV